MHGVNLDPQTAHIATAICLTLFGILGAFDGIYFHMIKYKLHQHPPATFEHRIHTFRGMLFVPIVALFFYWNVSGALLWIGILLLFIDFIAELVDIAIEKEARAMLGGINSAEAAIHVTATGFRMAALAIVLVSKPVESFLWSAEAFALPPYSEWLQLCAGVFIVGILIALACQAILALSAKPWSKCPFLLSCIQSRSKAL